MYIQCYKDNILKNISKYIKAYINNFIIYSKIFKDYIVYLKNFFN